MTTPAEFLPRVLATVADLALACRTRRAIARRRSSKSSRPTSKPMARGFRAVHVGQGR